MEAYTAYGSSSQVRTDMYEMQQEPVLLPVMCCMS